LRSLGYGFITQDLLRPNVPFESYSDNSIKIYHQQSKSNNYYLNPKANYVLHVIVVLLSKLVLYTYSNFKLVPLNLILNIHI